MGVGVHVCVLAFNVELTSFHLSPSLSLYARGLQLPRTPFYLSWFLAPFREQASRMKTTLQAPGKTRTFAARIRIHTPNADARIFMIAEDLCTENAVSWISVCLTTLAISAMETQAAGTSRRTVLEQ